MYSFGLSYRDGDSFITEGFTTREEAERARAEYAAKGYTEISEVLE